MLATIDRVRFFRGGVRTQQRDRLFQRPTPTPERNKAGVPSSGLRPGEDHAACYIGRRFGIG